VPFDEVRSPHAVAHDFNNALLAIVGNADLALARLDETADPLVRGALEEILDAGERAAELTRELLAEATTPA
jgi:two-component system cell cycle sensor histidine kinase/response regulator CckA